MSGPHEIMTSILVAAPASTPLGRWLGVTHDTVQALVERAWRTRFREPVPIRGGHTLRVGDTFRLNDDRQRFVLLATMTATRNDGKVVPVAIYIPLAGDNKPSRGDFSLGMYGGLVEKLRFPAPVFWGANARKQYDRYVEFMEKFGNADLIVPFESSKDKPDEPEPPPPPSDVDDPALADVVIRHSVQDGTTAHWDQGADRGRGENASIYHVVRRGGFVAAHRAGGVYRRTNSVGLTETRAPIAWMVGELHRRGFKVFLDLGTGSAAEAVERKREYLRERAEHMAERAEKKLSEAERRLGSAQERQTREAEELEISGYFPTPSDTALQVARLAQLEPGVRVLEPEAGHGALVAAVAEVEPGAQVDAVEVNHQLVEKLRDAGVAVVARDLLDPSFQPGTLYDRIVMNPPFEEGQSITHVLRAWEFLKPGGRLVAVMPESIAYRTDRKHTTFRQWLADRGAEDVDLPAQRYGRAQSIKTRIYVVDKPDDAPEVEGSAATLRGIAEAHQFAAEHRKALARSADREAATRRERYYELARRDRSGDLSKGERAELKALGMALAAERTADRAARIARGAEHVAEVDVSAGGRTAEYKRPHYGPSQTSDELLQAVVERFRKLKAPTGADKLERGHRSDKAVSVGLTWTDGGAPYEHSYTQLLGDGKSERRTETRYRDVRRVVEVRPEGEEVVVNLRTPFSYATYEAPPKGSQRVAADADAVFKAAVDLVRADPQVQAAMEKKQGPKQNPTQRWVYAIELDHPKGPALYVGQTGLSPEARFDQHRRGGMYASDVVHHYGVALRPERLGPFPSIERAERAERELANTLRAAGLTVFGRH